MLKLNTTTVTANGLYNAFPGIAPISGDSLIIVYRKGTAHVSTGSSIVSKTSKDGGKTWGKETLVYQDVSFDVRDPSITALSSGVLIISFFTYNVAGATAVNSWTIRSTDGGNTWDAPVRIAVPTSGTFYTAVSAPVVELRNGTLLVPLYGQYVAPVLNKCYQSTDGGSSWQELSNISGILNGGSSPHAEPVIAVLDNGNLICTLRNQATSKVSVSFSSSNGVIWSLPVDVFPGQSRANMIFDGDNGLCAYRTASGNGALREMWGGGGSWDLFERVFGSTVRAGFEYAAFIRLASGKTGMVWCAQDAMGAQSDCFFSVID